MPDFDRSILDEIRFSRLAGDEGPVELDWRHVAVLLAEQLDALAMRLAAAPGSSEADEERVARAVVALRQYRAACAECDDPT